MKTRILSAVSVLLALILLALPLAGCGESSADVTGTWETSVDLSKLINDAIASDADSAEMQEYVDISGFQMKLRMTLEKDGTYSVTLDEDALKESLDKLKKSLGDGLKAYFEDTMKDELEELSMTLEELLAMSGSSLDELIEQAFDEADLGDFSDFPSAGRYVAEDGKLSFSDSVDETPDGSDYLEYERSGSELRITGASDMTEEIAPLLPIVFRKVG